jgi:hypothetical protein
MLYKFELLCQFINQIGFLFGIGDMPQQKDLLSLLEQVLKQDQKVILQP